MLLIWKIGGKPRDSKPISLPSARGFINYVDILLMLHFTRKWGFCLLLSTVLKRMMGSEEADLHLLWCFRSFLLHSETWLHVPRGHYCIRRHKTWLRPIKPLKGTQMVTSWKGSMPLDSTGKTHLGVTPTWLRGHWFAIKGSQTLNYCFLLFTWMQHV